MNAEKKEIVSCLNFLVFIFFLSINVSLMISYMHKLSALYITRQSNLSCWRRMKEMCEWVHVSRAMRYPMQLAINILSVFFIMCNENCHFLLLASFIIFATIFISLCIHISLKIASTENLMNREKRSIFLCAQHAGLFLNCWSWFDIKYKTMSEQQHKRENQKMKGV